MSQVITERMVPVACDLIDRVRDRDPFAVQQLLRSLTAAEHCALTIVLAAMVPTDRSARDLLEWIDEPDLKPCGTHAAYYRHKARGEQPCEGCRRAERTYQRERKRRRAA